ncbi:TonB-dependent receptor [Terricaulis silvestris]|uniref:Pesticin receptor n=1 Tax=Terricaulis silvestris TaxID=2686094 RepID=A0A6I6MQJ4_9CAUL|nr:TonB-dependent receptor [Terricaulis silvestris]QGZ93822.1 Pesticin receptor [Terricaulis silvestris]
MDRSPRPRAYLFATASVILSTSLCSAAFAQDAPQAADVGNDEIVVTADRREGTIQDTPIAVSAFSGEALAEQGTVNVEGLAEITPSLHIYAEQINNEEYIIRGIGRSNEDLTTDSGVAVNINDIYVPQPSEANAALFDVDRVEVLRGPQGTLYGKNAVGGVINILTRAPTDTFGGYINAEIGELGRRQVETAISGPLIDNVLTGRLAGFGLHTDGAYTNLTLDEDANGQDVGGVRGSLRFTPSTDWQIDFIADYSNIEQDGVLKSTIVDVPGTPLILKDFFQAPYPTQEDDIRSGRSGLAGGQGIEQWGTSLSIDRYVEAGAFSFLSGYRTEESYNSEDVDRMPADLNNFFATQESWATSQELRFVSDDGGPLSMGGRLHWSAGLYWFHEEGTRDQSIFLFGCTPASQPCDPLTPDDPDDGLIGPGSPDYQNSTARFLQNLTTDSYGAYGEATFDFTEQLSLTAGLRYTSETKDFDLSASSVANELGGDPFTLFQPGGPFDASASETWEQFTPRFVLEYRPSDDIMAYASYAQGFKSGGFNGQAGTLDDMVPFDPEIADNYEVGLKLDLFDNRLRLNSAAFWIQFEDLQVSGVSQAGTVITNNAADASIEGIEIEAIARPVDGLTLRAGVSLLNATYEEYAIEVFDPTIMGGPPFFTLDLAGERIANIPEYSASVGIEYELPLSNGSELAFALDGTFKGDTVDNELNLRANEYSVWNARVGWTSSDGRYEIAGWVRNLTDEVYYRGGGAIPDFNKRTTRVGLVSDPRTVGVTLSTRLGEQ